jgi:hypothetical protein
MFLKPPHLFLRPYFLGSARHCPVGLDPPSLVKSLVLVVAPVHPHRFSWFQESLLEA